LIFQRFVPWPIVVPDFAASYASKGYFLCKEYKNATECREEQRKLDGWRSGEYSTFNFHLSNTALMLNVPVIRSPYSYNMFDGRRFQDFNLGLRAIESKGAEDYWNAVEFRIEQSLTESKVQWDNWIMHKVFVTGEGVHEERFREMVQKICTYKGIDIEFFMDDDTTLTATGTAELAKRDLYLNPNQPHPTVP
jgi:hypothetical protein